MTELVDAFLAGGDVAEVPDGFGDHAGLDKSRLPDRLRTGWLGGGVADHLGVAVGGQTPGRERPWHPAAFPSILGFSRS
jgi:hypothetical protein